MKYLNTIILPLSVVILFSGCVSPTLQGGQKVAMSLPNYSNSSTSKDNSSSLVTLKDLEGDWISDSPLILDDAKMLGFDIGGNEGIMYAAMFGNARGLPSSYDYSLNGQKLNLKINFSAAGLPIGKIYVFDIEIKDDGSLLMTYKTQSAIYKRLNR